MQIFRLLASKCRSVFESKYDELEETIFDSNRSIFSEEVFSQKNFLQTAIVMRARIHPPLDNDKIALVPFADQVRADSSHAACFTSLTN